MSWAQIAIRGRKRALLAWLGVSLSLAVPAFADSELENARLTALLRQLDVIERLAQDSAAVAPMSGTRYHFDYARLHADLARLRAGIEDYLSPRRAQPRDPTTLDGAYRREAPPADVRAP